MGVRNRVVVPARQATQAGGIDTLESIPGLHKSLKIPALDTYIFKSGMAAYYLDIFLIGLATI